METALLMVKRIEVAHGCLTWLVFVHLWRLTRHRFSSPMEVDSWGVPLLRRKVTDTTSILFIIAATTTTITVIGINIYALREEKRTLKTKAMITLASLGTVASLILVNIEYYSPLTGPFVSWLVSFVSNYVVAMIVLMEMELLKTFCQLGKLLTPGTITKIQIGFIFFYLISMTPVFMNFMDLGHEPQTTAKLSFIVLDIWICTCFIYDIWQTIYVIHLLITNIKLLAANKLIYHEFTLPTRSRNDETSGISFKSESSMIKSMANAAQLDDFQSHLLKRLIATSALGFIFLIGTTILVFISQHSYSINGNDDFYLYCQQLIFLTSSFHVCVIFSIFKQVQNLCLASARSFKSSPSPNFTHCDTNPGISVNFTKSSPTVISN